MTTKMTNQSDYSNYTADELCEAWEKAMEEDTFDYKPGWLGEIIDTLLNPNEPDIVEIPGFTAWIEEDPDATGDDVPRRIVWE
jgi:hypothetical protein